MWLGISQKRIRWSSWRCLENDINKPNHMKTRWLVNGENVLKKKLILIVLYVWPETMMRLVRSELISELQWHELRPMDPTPYCQPRFVRGCFYIKSWDPLKGTWSFGTWFRNTGTSSRTQKHNLTKQRRNFRHNNTIPRNRDVIWEFLKPILRPLCFFRNILIY